MMQSLYLKAEPGATIGRFDFSALVHALHEIVGSKITFRNISFQERWRVLVMAINRPFAA
jgi:cell fate regulator YaaT (PSP1 superfamily)